MGEEHYEQHGAEGGGGSKVWVIVLVVIAAVCLLGIVIMGVLGALLMPALMKAKEQANTTKCSNNLRQLGLAALQYTDDKRFSPHVTGLQELDGDANTNHGPKVVRVLLNMGYSNSPEAFICPSSYDRYLPTRNYDTRVWAWEGLTRTDPTAEPLTDGTYDPTLVETDELSYGWTRRAYNSSMRSTVPLAADRSLRQDDVDAAYLEPGEAGNHTDGVNVVQADASVRFRNTDLDPNAFSDLLAPDGDALGLVSPRQ